jgi:hypothetical protein
MWWVAPLSNYTPAACFDDGFAIQINILPITLAEIPLQFFPAHWSIPDT